MAEGDRAAVHVRALLVEAELADDLDDLRRERLVELDDGDVVERQAGLRERLRDRLDGADAHDLRVHARGREADEPTERRQAELGRRARRS